MMHLIKHYPALLLIGYCLVTRDSLTLPINQTLPTNKTEDTQRIVRHHGSFSFDYTQRLVGVAGMGCLNQMVVLFGCGTSVINMVVFYRLGLNVATNFSFFALAVSDFGSLVALVPTNCMTYLWLRMRTLSFDPERILLLISLLPHVIFTRVTVLTTAFISLEKCLCVILPLQVKTIATRNRTGALILLFYTPALLSAAPIYYSNRFAYQFYPSINQTRLSLVPIPESDEIEAISGPIEAALLTVLPFILICICTAILVGSLRRKSLWRQRAVTENVRERTTKKDVRVCKMIIILSALFISCFTPVMVIFAATLARSGYGFADGKVDTAMFACGVLGILLEGTNSSMNMIVYYKFSTKYRLMFCRFFHLKYRELKRR